MLVYVLTSMLVNGDRMVRVAKGEWVGPALALLEETRDLDASARRRRLEAVGRERGTAAQTLHRQLVAARWLVQRCPLYDVKISDVRAAWTGVEALARLEEARPDHAALLSRDVLLGITPSREIINAATIAPRRNGGRWPNFWQVFLMDEIGFLLPFGAATIETAAQDHSEIGRLLRVDVEWNAADGDKYAVFLSPKLIFAQNATLVDVFKGVSTARLHYTLVAFVTFDPAERAFMVAHEPSPIKGLADLVMPRDVGARFDAAGHPRADVEVTEPSSSSERGDPPG